MAHLRHRLPKLANLRGALCKGGIHGRPSRIGLLKFCGRSLNRREQLVELPGVLDGQSSQKLGRFFGNRSADGHRKLTQKSAKLNRFSASNNAGELTFFFCCSFLPDVILFVVIMFGHWIGIRSGANDLQNGSHDIVGMNHLFFVLSVANN
jgi:hypothetical protein